MVAELADLIQVVGAILALLGAAGAAWRSDGTVEDIARSAALGAVAGTYLALIYWLLTMTTE
jgi:hypothetical protein